MLNYNFAIKNLNVVTELVLNFTDTKKMMF